MSATSVTIKLLSGLTVIGDQRHSYRVKSEDGHTIAVIVKEHDSFSLRFMVHWSLSIVELLEVAAVMAFLGTEKER